MKKLFYKFRKKILNLDFIITHYPIDFLEYILEIVRRGINDYDSKFREELSNNLFNLIIANIINDSILKTFKILTDGSAEFLEGILPEILKKITNNQIDSGSAIILFDYFEEFYFEGHIDIVKEVLSEENNRNQLKRRIIEALSKSKIAFDSLQDLLIELYEKTEDNRLKSVT